MAYSCAWQSSGSHWPSWAHTQRKAEEGGREWHPQNACTRDQCSSDSRMHLTTANEITSIKFFLFFNHYSNGYSSLPVE